MSKKLSRRDFLKNAAAAGAGFAALGLFGQSAKAEAQDKYTPGTYTAEKTISYAELYNNNLILECSCPNQKPSAYLPRSDRLDTDALPLHRSIPCRSRHSS